MHGADALCNCIVQIYALCKCIVQIYSVDSTPTAAFVPWAMRLLSVSLQKGDTEMYCRPGLVLSREQGSQNDAGLEAPVLRMPD